MKGLRCISSTKRKKGQDSITDEIPICGFLNDTKIYKKKKIIIINFVKSTIVNKYLHAINSTLL